MIEIGLGHYLTLGAIIFFLGVIGIFLNRKNVIVILMSVELILLSDNFISVKKTEKASWESIKPSVIACLNDYFQSNKKPILKKEDKDEPISENKNDNTDVVNQINEVIE